MNNYWNGNGTYQSELNKLIELVPNSGKCDTLAGELIRSVNCLSYDFYNNGMGNNTSGAINFLGEKGAISEDVYEIVHEYTRGRTYNGTYEEDEFHSAIVELMDQTILFIKNNPVMLTTANTEDMFDYSEDKQLSCEECGVELDRYTSSGFGHICSDCYYEEEEYDDEDDY